MKKYNVGDSVWYAMFEHRQVSKICPVCFGKRVVTLILGNDEHIELECAFCKLGYESATGNINDYEFISSPEIKKITDIKVSLSSSGEKREYFSDCHILGDEDIFDNKEDALKRSEEKAKEYFESEATRGNHRKDLTNKSYSWSAGYWRREAKRHREEAERYEKNAVVCLGKSKCK